MQRKRVQPGEVRARGNGEQAKRQPANGPVNQLTHDTIVIGTSAGGHESLARLVKTLPGDLEAAVFIVMHFPSDFAPVFLARSGALPVAYAQDEEPIRLGRIYLAPPDQHLIVKQGHIRLLRGPKENRFRPAIDPLFRSAAIAYGPRVIGVVLSGMLDDGTAGALAIQQCGGMCIAQDPEQALFRSMPESAIKGGAIDFVKPLEELGALLTELVATPIDHSKQVVVPRELQIEQSILEQAMNGMEGNQQLGKTSMLTCPECNGVLWEVTQGDLLRYRCHVGHSYTADSMFAEQSQSLENSLWAAIRAFEERSKLCDSMALRNRERGLHRAAEDLALRAAESKQHGDTLRNVLLNGHEFSQTHPTLENHLSMQAEDRAGLESKASQ